MAQTYSIAEIGAALGLTVWGDGTVRISAAAEPGTASETDLALAMKPSYAKALEAGGARAALVWADADPKSLGLSAALLAPRPRFAMAGLTALLDPGPDLDAGIHPSAAVAADAEIGPGARIGPFVTVGRAARIGKNARIAAHCSIGAGAVLGDDALLRERVTLCDRVRIGHRFVAQPGAVIGGDGFSFVTPEPDAIEAVRTSLGERGDARQQRQVRIHSLGAVHIGDDVEIGANSCIDRGTIADTAVGDGTKIDNQVMIGHNVRIGKDCLLCGQVGIAGSSVIGDRVVLGARAGITDHLTIGDDVIAAAGTVFRTNQPAGRVMMGDPALPMQQNISVYKAMRRLPRLLDKLRAMERPDGS